MTVVSVLELPIRPGGEPAFVRRFAELRIFERSHESGGFLGGQVLRPLCGKRPFLVIATWDNADAYQAWLDNPARDAIGAELEALLDTDGTPAGELYEAVPLCAG